MLRSRTYKDGRGITTYTVLLSVFLLQSLLFVTRGEAVYGTAVRPWRQLQHIDSVREPGLDDQRSLYSYNSPMVIGGEGGGGGGGGGKSTLSILNQGLPYGHSPYKYPSSPPHPSSQSKFLYSSPTHNHPLLSLTSPTLADVGSNLYYQYDEESGGQSNQQPPILEPSRYHQREPSEPPGLLEDGGGSKELLLTDPAVVRLLASLYRVTPSYLRSEGSPLHQLSSQTGSTLVDASLYGRSEDHHTNKPDDIDNVVIEDGGAKNNEGANSQSSSMRLNKRYKTVALPKYHSEDGQDVKPPPSIRQIEELDQLEQLQEPSSKRSLHNALTTIKRWWGNYHRHRPQVDRRTPESQHYSCLRNCIMEGKLLPIQCHSLC